MQVAVMDIGIVRMLMRHNAVNMLVRVRLLAVPGEGMDVSVMRIVPMLMVVLQR